MTVVFLPPRHRCASPCRLFRGHPPHPSYLCDRFLWVFDGAAIGFFEYGTFFFELKSFDYLPVFFFRHCLFLVLRSPPLFFFFYNSGLDLSPAVLFCLLFPLCERSFVLSTPLRCVAGFGYINCQSCSPCLECFRALPTSFLSPNFLSTHSPISCP